MSKDNQEKNTQSENKDQNDSILNDLLNSKDQSAMETNIEEPEAVEVNQPQSMQTVSNGNPSESQQKEKAHTSAEEKKGGLTEKEKLLMRTGQGVNLIPKKSKEEVKKEEKKFTFSVSSMVSLLLLLTLSLGVVLFNIFSKSQLNRAKEDLYKQEVRLENYSSKYQYNKEIIDRIDLYKKFEQSVFSPKEIIEYIMGMVDKSGKITINAFNIDDNLNFEITGNTTDLGIVAKIWYLMSTDENVLTVNLSSVGKGENGVSFAFDGKLNIEYFIEN